MHLSRLTALTILLVARAAMAQEMIGPSTDPSRAVVEPPPAAEPEPEPPVTEEAEVSGEVRDTVGEDVVVRPAGPDEESAPADDGGATVPETGATATDDAAAEDGQQAADATGDEAPEEGGETASYSDLYQARWQQLMESGNFSGAARSSQDWVREAQRREGEDSLEAFIAFSYMGEAWSSAEDHARAEQAFRSAVEIVEEQLGVFHPSLIEPLGGLAQALMEQKRLESATSALLRAKDITHRNLGIFNLEQEEISHDLTRAYVGQGEIQKANREQRFVFSANEKAYGASPELVPALQRWAQWNVRVQRFSDARRYYQRALQILEDTYGPNDLRLIETLNMIARSFYSNEVTTFPREGSRALERSIEIYKAQEFVDQADLLRAQTRLGDWYMLAGSRSRSIAAYADAVKTAEEAGVDPNMLNAIYGQPRPLESSDMPVGVLGSRLASVTGGNRRILVEFSVDTRGRARNIQIIEDTVKLVSVARAVRERVALTSFRPRFVDGVATMTDGVRMSFEFEVSPGAVVPTGQNQIVEDGGGGPDADDDAAQDAAQMDE